MTRRSPALVVLKFGGELLDDARSLRDAARVVARAARSVRLVVVHGGGKEIDRALERAGIQRRQVDGVRITDAATLDVVVAVLAGGINTRLVAAINAAGGHAVGLTAADAGLGPVARARPHRASAGGRVNLGLVGEPPVSGTMPLVDLLCARGFVPVIACVGAARDGQLLNVNADTLAASLAARLRACRLVVAGATPGVLDGAGRTLPQIDAQTMRRLVKSGDVTAGMIAKLRACHRARERGVPEVVIASGRSSQLLSVIAGSAPAQGAWTRLT